MGRGMSQIFHSVFIAFCLCRSGACDFLLRTCYSSKVEDLGHRPVEKVPLWRGISPRSGISGSSRPGWGKLKRNLQVPHNFGAGGFNVRGLEKTMVPLKSVGATVVCEHVNCATARQLCAGRRDADCLIFEN